MSSPVLGDCDQETMTLNDALSTLTSRLLLHLSVDDFPSRVHIPRRHAFRYVKFYVMSTSSRYGIRIRDPVATAVTSAPWQDPAPLSFEHFQGDLTADQKTMLRKIDQVSITTLRDCMQTVFEDGPRRDRRLW